MKFKSSLLAQASGSLAGTVFSRNKGGNYTRNRTIPTNPNTPKQSAVRAAFTQLATAWRGLTQVQRDAWNAATALFPYTDKLGDQRIYSGSQLFVKFNLNLLNAGQTRVDAPPAPTVDPVVSLVNGTIEVTAGNLTTFSVTLSGDVPADFDLIIYTSPATSIGVSSIRSVKLARTHVAGAGTPTPVLMQASYVATHGQPFQGGVVFVEGRLVARASGQSFGAGNIRLGVAEA